MLTYPVNDPEDGVAGAPGGGDGLHLGAGLTDGHGPRQDTEEHLGRKGKE